MGKQKKGAAHQLVIAYDKQNPSAPRSLKKRKVVPLQKQGSRRNGVPAGGGALMPFQVAVSPGGKSGSEGAG